MTRLRNIFVEKALRVRRRGMVLGSMFLPILILLPLVASSGCATVKVSKMGRPIKMGLSKPEEIRVGRDGSVAIETVILEKADHSGARTDYRRYVVGSPEVVWSTLPIGRSPKVGDHGPERVSMGVTVSPSSGKGWHLVPDRLRGGSADYSQLPEPLREGVEFYSPFEPFPYRMGDRSLLVEITSLSLDRERREVRPRWYYPSRVLYVPALAFDIVTSPVQLAGVVIILVFAKQM